MKEKERESTIDQSDMKIKMELQTGDGCHFRRMITTWRVHFLPYKDDVEDDVDQGPYPDDT